MSFAGATNDLPAEGSGLDYSDIGANQRKGAATLPFSEGLADTASGAFLGATRALGDYVGLDQQASRARLDQQFNVDPTADPGGALIDPKEWQTKYPDLGLTFTPDMGQAQAQLLVDHRTDELRRQYVIDHSPNTLMAKTARGLTDFAVSALDPLNIAATLVPGVGETRAGLWAAKLGLGKTAARLIEGGTAGAAGMAGLTPLDAAEAHAYQDHYGPMDAFANVAFGTVLGGGLHAGFGKLSDFLSRAAPETREAAMRAAVGQAVEGRPVDVEPVLASDPGLSRSGTPPVEDGFTRFYHGGAPYDGEGGRWLTPSEPYARDGYTAPSDGRIVQYVDVPNDHPTISGEVAPGFDDINGIYRHFEAPADVAAGLQPYQSPETSIAADPRSAIDRARQNSIDFANGREPSPVAARPEAAAHADAIIKTGDDPAAELADAQSRVQAYKAQGIISDEEHAAFNDANAADDEAAKARTDAASAAARCLFLHP